MQKSLLYIKIIQIVCYPLLKAPKVWNLLNILIWMTSFVYQQTFFVAPCCSTLPLTSSTIPPLAPQPSSPQPSQLQVSLGPPAPLPPWEWSQLSPHAR